MVVMVHFCYRIRRNACVSATTGVLQSEMSIHGPERVDIHREDEAEQIERSLFGTAITVWENSRIRTTLDLFMSGKIHEYAGGSLRAADKSGHIFWHDHGTFVAEDGMIYHLRTDDEGTPQVYVSPTDGRGSGLYCIQPYTYDGYMSPDGAEMRFDFTNSIHHASPTNSLIEMELQRSDGLDVVRPRHQNGVVFDHRRDSIALTHNPDGTVRVQLHDSKTGHITRLHDSIEIKSILELIDTLE